MSTPARCMFVLVALIGLLGTIDDVVTGGDLGPLAAGSWTVIVLFVLGALSVIDRAAQHVVRGFRSCS